MIPLKLLSSNYKKVFLESSLNEGPINYYVFRRLSLGFVWVSEKARINPNQLSILSLVLGLTSAILFSTGSYIIALSGLIPFHLGKIIDCADGQLANLTNQKSKLGAFIDPLFDRIVDITTLCGLTVFSYKSGDKTVVIFFIIFLILWYLSLYLSTHSELDRITPKTYKQKKYKLTSNLLRWDGGFGSLVFTLAIITRRIDLLLILYIFTSTIIIYSQLSKIVDKYTGSNL